MQQPYRENREHIAEILLFKADNSEQTEEKKAYLRKLWNARQHILKTRPRTQDQ